MNPGNRPRRTLAALAGAAVVVAGLTVLVVGVDSREAEAEALQRFASCAELEAWGEESTGSLGRDGSGDFAPVSAEMADTAAGSAEGSAPAEDQMSGSGAGSGGADPDTGGTNVIVEGVDELDLVDRLEGDVWLVASAGRLAVVDLAAGTLLAAIEVGEQPTVSYDPDSGLAWVIGHDTRDWSLEVHRIAVSAETLTSEGSWEVDGSLVAARRIGGQLHVVATDGFYSRAGEVLPFSGAAVPCDQVLHPEGPSQPAATLVATFDPTGAVEPTAATQVVGSGELVHLTHDAVYLATPQWEQDGVTTGIHRFALEGLSLTGSGQVEGSLLNEFSMSEHDGLLRVAVTHGGGGFLGDPMAVDVDWGDVDVAPAEPNQDIAPSAADQTVGEVPVDAEPVPLPEPIATTPITPIPVEPPGDPESVLNEVVVLDIRGDLDVVGRTERFGKPHETIHGIRFVGSVAYAVTFLNTDPFYVIDLADPASPTVVGALELPGFSAYLHPIGDGHVVGFGPDERGRASAKLFDVTDPTSPQVVDAVVLGGESAVVWDHHAFVSLGEQRFAVPAGDYRSALPPGCTSQDQSEQLTQVDGVYEEIAEMERQAVTDDDWRAVEEAWNDIDRRVAEELPCAYLESSVVSAAVTLEVADGRLVEVERHEVATAHPAPRIIPGSVGWTFLDDDRLVLLDTSGAEWATVSLVD